MWITAGRAIVVHVGPTDRSFDLDCRGDGMGGSSLGWKKSGAEPPHSKTNGVPVTPGRR
jgi:hypothetical protein